MRALQQDLRRVRDGVRVRVRVRVKVRVGVMVGGAHARGCTCLLGGERELLVVPCAHDHVGIKGVDGGVGVHAVDDAFEGRHLLRGRVGVRA